MRKTIHNCAFVAFGLALLASSPILSQGHYVRLEGVVKSQQSEAGVLPFHLDAYKVAADGQRQLVRLSRFTEPEYHLYLEAGCDHEIVVQMLGHPPHTVLIKAINPAADTGERLTLQKDFLVPAAPGSQAIASAPVAPPKVRIEEIRPVSIEVETADLFMEWGEPVLVAVPLPGEPLSPVSVDFEETGFVTDWGSPVDIPVPLVVEETTLPIGTYGASVKPMPGLINSGQTTQVVATFGITTIVGAPEHPGTFQRVINAALPPAPRRVLLRRPANIVAGLHSGQQSQAIARLPKGQELQVIEYTTPDWWMVSYGSVIGWMEARYLE